MYYLELSPESYKIFKVLLTTFRYPNTRLFLHADLAELGGHHAGEAKLEQLDYENVYLGLCFDDSLLLGETLTFQSCIGR
jgi:hypothetical protein